MKSKTKDNTIQEARIRVDEVKTRLEALNHEFELTQDRRKELIDSLQNQLGHCRNATERQLIHDRIEHEKKETIAISKVYKHDLNQLDIELSDRYSDLRVAVNDVYEKEYQRFRSCLPLVDDARKAYAAHSMTFTGGSWRDFLESLWPEPSSFELDEAIEELKEDIYG